MFVALQRPLVNMFCAVLHVIRFEMSTKYSHSRYILMHRSALSFLHIKELKSHGSFMAVSEALMVKVQ